MWQGRITALLNTTTTVFYKGDILTEPACEPFANCNTDQLSFKAYFSSWLASTSLLAPFTAQGISPLISTTASAAAQQCSGPLPASCGFAYTKLSAYDGSTGVGQQMSALSAIQVSMLLVPDQKVRGPLTNSTGGTSVGDAEAGRKTGNGLNGVAGRKVTLGDRVGAGILTALVLGGVVGGTFVMVH